MEFNKLLVGAAIAAVVSAGINVSAIAKPPPMEKCAGIVKAGKNDCGSGGNACAGQDKVDKSPEAWIYLPKGTCEKIVGGKVLSEESKTAAS